MRRKGLENKKKNTFVAENAGELYFFCKLHPISEDSVFGEMLEWLKRHAWKACIPLKGIGGSNPPLSANKQKLQGFDFIEAFFVFVSQAEFVRVQIHKHKKENSIL